MPAPSLFTRVEGMRRVKRSDIPREEILEACRRFHRGEADTPDVALAKKYPVKVILARMAQLVEEGLLDYGVSLRTAWAVEGKTFPS
jgi:hypothetical protein